MAEAGGSSGVVDAGFITRLRKAVRDAVKGPEERREASVGVVKALVRTTPQGGPGEAWEAVAKHLQGNSTGEREGALKMVDVLLRRSQAFRTRTVACMDKVVASVVGKGEKRVPGDEADGQRLRSAALAIIRGWEEEFAGRDVKFDMATR
eukprot:CAMPEP_0169465982 /NCGR_PEP_ID=MMETSP1042-20121227/21519_1 /TAXON_ID=464988 /ORGANISM="Hemiselmis andersenii, Strain CCMP1180" /LENGTH=149 /DNA_ID=CAMNT_0009578993 /DNA_START=106 /DNA_END=552 /DNA_ORIENTATION=+